MAELKPEKCDNCGATIGRLETPMIWDEHVVCAACYKKLGEAARAAGAPHAPPSAPAPSAAVGQIGTPPRESQRMKAALILGVALVALLLVGVLFNAGPRGLLRMRPVAPTILTLTPHDWTSIHQAYILNELGADNRFKGKWTLVGGMVFGTGRTSMGAPYVSLGDFVQCTFDEPLPRGQASALGTLGYGQEVWVVGKCDGEVGSPGADGNPQLPFNHCRIVADPGGKPIRFAVPD